MRVSSWLRWFKGHCNLHLTIIGILLVTFVGSLALTTSLLRGDQQRLELLLEQTHETSELNRVLALYVELRDRVDEYQALGVDGKIADIEKGLLTVPDMIRGGIEQYTLAVDVMLELDTSLEGFFTAYQEAKVRAAEIARLTPPPPPPPPPPKTTTTVKVPTSESASSYSKWEKKTVKTSSRGSFSVDVVTINLNNPRLKIFTDTRSNKECSDDCPVAALNTYVSSVKGFAGIHGTYFCPISYASCASDANAFFSPVYDTLAGRWVNQRNLSWNDRALIAFDTANNPYFYAQSSTFGGFGNLRAAIGNWPGLVQNGNIIVGSYSTMDDKQKNVKGYRGGIGFTGKTLYLVVARSATVPDLAYIMKAMGIQNALNLDGGGTSALIYNGRYKVGPGRAMPNAIMFSQ